ncbi:MAG TPA: cytochrome c3 family protein [Anaerolineaceae bacterium]|nr:cytochrome c3 family protein [Anaerolineaceae bacterium]
MLLTLAVILIASILFGPASVASGANPVSPDASAPTASTPAPAKPAQKDNLSCLECHEKPGQTMTLPDGSLLSITIDKSHFLGSTHGVNQVGCTDCHTDIHGYPHPEFFAQDLRDVALNFYQVCQKCHEEKYRQAADSVHQHAIANGNKNAAVCSDCHNAHEQPTLTNPLTGSIKAEERIKIPYTCARCHSQIFQEYGSSAHGRLLLSTGNLDVPVCTDCHGVHNIPDPTTARFRLNSPQLCAGCHTDKVKMAKYGLSTNVLNTYVADFHGTTVTLFQKQSPDQASNKPVCFDCHGAHNIAQVGDLQRGLKIKQNLLATCKRCHPGATENFPASWLSHYTPNPQTTPLVYFVQVFYNILIPLVIGGMIVFVISDFIRRTIERRKGASHS